MNIHHSARPRGIRSGGRARLSGVLSAIGIWVALALAPAPATAQTYCEKQTPPNQVVTGATTGGQLQGTNEIGYTIMSSLAMAAVHAGLAEPGQSVALQVVSLGERASFWGSRAFGIASESFLAPACAMRLARDTTVPSGNPVPATGGQPQVQTRTAQRATDFLYDTTTGLLLAETVEPGAAAGCARTSYVRDASGNVTSASVSDCGTSGVRNFTSRTTRTLYAAQSVRVGTAMVTVPAGVHVSGIVNALGQQTLRQTEPAYGRPVQHTDANGLVTRTEYDAFGRKTLEVVPDGSQIHYRFCFLPAAGRDLSANGAGCTQSGFAPALAVSYVETQERDAGGEWGPSSRKYLDALGRVIRQVDQPFESEGLQADARIVQDTIYTETGAVLRATAPYLSGPTVTPPAEGNAAIGWTSSDYDALGRPVTVYVRDDAGAGSRFGQRVATASFKYEGLRVTERRSREARGANGAAGSTGQLVTLRISNPIGQLEQVVDTLGGTLRRGHDPFGNLVEVRDALDNRVTASFDIRGNRVELLDPNAGRWTYAYNAVGELVEQRSPNQLAAGTVTMLSYDALGRLVERKEPEYSTRWSYDQYFGGGGCNWGVGKLCEVSTSHGLSRRHVYDSKGRQTQVQQDTLGQKSFVSSWSYDARGNLARYEYPSGIALEYGYTKRGFLSQITRAAGLNKVPVWTLRRVDARGQPLEYLLGSVQQAGRQAYDPLTGRQTGAVVGDASGHILNQSYEWDTAGNLTRRSDRYAPPSASLLTETFDYDLLNRLVAYQTSSPALPSPGRKVTLTYDGVGNITSKSDVGSYAYQPSGTSSVRPAAVASVSGPEGSRSFTYDAAGNLVSSTGGRYTRIDYTSFNLPSAMSGPEGDYSWKYGPDHERIYEYKAGRSTWYHHPDNAGGLAYETEGYISRHYVMAMGRVVQMFESLGSSVIKTRWWHADHLGSVTAITDEQNAVVQRFSYDPFGKRREITGAASATNLRFDYPATTDRGFTGHEHLDDVGVVHMNGRTYDPHIGRFMQADPVVQDADNLQNYNRYSYVLNNPLNATDPSGHFIFAPVFAAIFADVAYGLTLAELASGGMLFEAAIAGAVGTGINAAILGADPKATLKAAAGGGIGALLAGAIGAELGHPAASPATDFTRWIAKGAAHGVAGCVASRIANRNCSSGAAGAAVGSLLGFAADQLDLGEVANAGIRGAIGGFASKVAGGKFTNGAATAAFGYLFNEASGREDGWDRTSGRAPNTRGREAENLVRADLETRGYMYIDRQPSLVDAPYERTWDLLMRAPDGVLAVVESKSTLSGLFTDNPRQVAMDVHVLTNGGKVLAPTTGNIFLVRRIVYQGVDFTTHIAAGLANWRAATIIRQRGGDATIQRVGPKQ